MTARRGQPAHTALGAVIAARAAELGVHVVEVAPGQFDVVLRVGGPWVAYADAHREPRNGLPTR